MWSFGHLVILPFYALLLDLSFISWLKIGFVAYLMKRKNRAGGNEKEVSTCSVLFIYFLTLYFPVASSSAMASWSGQLVPFEPHSMPLRRAITSSAFWPLTNELMPCRLPWQPPANVTLKMVLSSLSSMSIRRLHVPLVV